MIRKTAISAVLIAGAVILLSAMTLLAQDKMFTYNYSFKPGSEPDGFRGMKVADGHRHPGPAAHHGSYCDTRAVCLLQKK